MDSLNIQSHDGKNTSVSLNGSKCWPSTKPDGRDVVRLRDGTWIARSPGASSGMVVTMAQASRLLLANGHEPALELWTSTVRGADLDIRSVCPSGFQA